MGAYAVFLRTLGQPSGQMMGLIAFNLVFGFLASGISWEGHLGGLAGGVLVAWLYSQTRKADQQGLQKLGLFAITMLLIVLSVIRVSQLG